MLGSKRNQMNFGDCGYQKFQLLCMRQKSTLGRSQILAISDWSAHRFIFCTCESALSLTVAVFCETWMQPSVPVESILEASFTVSPQMSKTGFVAPMTPHTRGPMLMPAINSNDDQLINDYDPFDREIMLSTTGWRRLWWNSFLEALKCQLGSRPATGPTSGTHHKYFKLSTKAFLCDNMCRGHPVMMRNIK